MDKVIHVVNSLLGLFFSFLEVINHGIQNIWLLSEAAHPDTESGGDDLGILIIFVNDLALNQFC